MVATKCTHVLMLAKCDILELKRISAEKTVTVMVGPDALLPLMAINSRYVDLARGEDVVERQALQNVK
jgi:hypothetical protein